PRFVQIQDAGDHARVIVAKPVAMPPVERAGRIDRIVPFERIETEEERPVERETQAFQRFRERNLSGAVRVLVEPDDAIAADVAALDATLGTADAGGLEFAG